LHMEILQDLFAWPFFGLLRAIVGVLWPSADANTRKLQRITIAVVVAGIVLLLIGVAWVWVVPQVYALLPFLGAYLSFVVAGIIGESIEEACREEGKKEQGPTKPL
jgi:hypothetical protein